MKLTKSKRLNSLLESICINTIKDLLLYFPKRYEDYSLTPLDDIKDKSKIVVEALVCTTPYLVKKESFSIIKFSILTKDNRYFNVQAISRDYLLKVFVLKKKYVISGIYSSKFKSIILLSFLNGELLDHNVIKPIYSLPKGLKQSTFRNIIKRYLLHIKQNIKTIIPDSYLKKYHLVDKFKALYYIHSPKNKKELNEGFRFFKYEEGFSFALFSIFNCRRTISSQNKVDIKLLDDVASLLPYKLTPSQKTSLKDIVSDMNSDKKMNRFLLGDVGSGKTIVGLLTLYLNTFKKGSGVLLCPTEILAFQHYETAKKFLRMKN